MTLAVDLERCQGNGVCAERAPEVFELDDGGRLTLLQADPPPDLHRAVRDAVRRCPTRALTFEA